MHDVMSGKNTSHHKRTSPALKLALMMWLLGCSLVIIRVYSNADERVAALANLYYQAPAIVLMALWLWVRFRGGGEWREREGRFCICFFPSRRCKLPFHACAFVCMCVCVLVFSYVHVYARDNDNAPVDWLRGDSGRRGRICGCGRA